MQISRENNALVYRNENGEILAEITWQTLDANTINANHTYVAPSLRGQGVAAQLLDALVALAKAEGWKIHATCSYVARQFAASEKYADIQAK